MEVGDVEKDGKIRSKERIKKFLSFIKEYEEKSRYDFIMLSYSEIDSYIYNIGEIKENFIKDCGELVSLGFDGVHIDIEPVRLEQRGDYLDLLKRFAVEFPENKILSVYSGAVGSDYSDNEWEWPLGFYEEAARNVDLIFVPGYDLGLNDERRYRRAIEKQIGKLSSIEYSHLILGVPTHKQEPETIENALEAFSIAGQQKNQFIGVAIFAEWTIDKSEWKIFEEYL